MDIKLQTKIKKGRSNLENFFSIDSVCARSLNGPDRVKIVWMVYLGMNME